MVTYRVLDTRPCDVCRYCEWCKRNGLHTVHHLEKKSNLPDEHEYLSVMVCVGCLREKGLLW
jgi:hypothetical protein